MTEGCFPKRPHLCANITNSERNYMYKQLQGTVLFDVKGSLQASRTRDAWVIVRAASLKDCKLMIYLYQRLFRKNREKNVNYQKKKRLKKCFQEKKNFPICSVTLQKDLSTSFQTAASFSNGETVKLRFKVKTFLPSCPTFSHWSNQVFKTS